MYDRPSDWKLTAALVEGLNINWAPGMNSPNQLDRSLRRDVIARFAKAKEHCYQVLPHGAGGGNDWQALFDRAANYGYRLEYLYTYNAGPGKIWKPEEHERLRQWLDEHGHGDVRIAFNARSGKHPLERPVVQGNGIECDLASWRENKGGRHELLRWMADPDNPATKGEKIFIHCHLNFGQASKETDLVGAWAAARRMVRDIGRDILNTEELRNVFRSNRLVFSFFGANWTTPAIRLLPELRDDRTYAESYIGVLLSLIEQRELFHGTSGSFPTDEQCENFERLPPQEQPCAGGTPARMMRCLGEKEK